MIKVYRYGLLPPIDQAAEVREQMFGGHRYRNALIEIERERRAAHRALLSSDPIVADLEQRHAQADARCTSIAHQIAASKSDARTSKVPAELRMELDGARDVRKDLANHLKEARRIARAAMSAARQRIEEHAAERAKAAYAARACAWGTAGFVNRAADKSRQDLGKKPGEQDDPGFRRWTGEGVIAVQVQRDQAIEQIEGDTHTFVRIMPGRAITNQRGRVLPVPKGAKTLYLRIGSVGLPGRMNEPVFAAFPMAPDRAIPPGSKISYVSVHVRRIGPREEWWACLTVDLPEQARPVASERAVAIDIGWRLFPDGIRVAVWRGSDGASGEIRLTDGETLASGLRNLDLPRAMIGGLRKAEGIQQVRDRLFNEILAKLVAWLAKHDLPAWSIAQWRSKGRLAALISHWPRGRFEGLEGEADIVAAMLEWLRIERHLWPYESDQRVGAERARREIYRRLAKELGRRYQTLVLEDFDLRQEREPVESETVENDTARSNKKIVALSEFRGALANVFGEHVVKLDPAYSTLACHACGVVNEFDAAKTISHRCASCSLVWDQDENAARNLLAWWERQPDERSGDGENAESARSAKKPAPKEKMWARLRRLKAEKALLEGARQVDDNAAE